VRYRATAIALTVVAVGCGVPSSVTKQAEDLASIAAEGSLLAGDVAEGDSTEPFVKTHADSLRKNAATLRKAISHPDLRLVAGEVVTELARLAASPGPRTAAGVERRLDDAATRAEEIGKAAR
jgi:hypothetical protein